MFLFLLGTPAVKKSYTIFYNKIDSWTKLTYSATPQKIKPKFGLNQNASKPSTLMDGLWPSDYYKFAKTCPGTLEEGGGGLAILYWEICVLAPFP